MGVLNQKNIIMKYLWLLLSFIFFITACSTRNETQDCIDLAIDETITIEEGDFICLPAGEEIEIQEISNELCPCEVVCVSPGIIRYSLDITLSDGLSVPGEMWAAPDQEFRIQMETDSLPYIFESTEVVFEEECSLSNGNPDIASAQLTLIR
jgi:hypothetical protein